MYLSIDFFGFAQILRYVSLGHSTNLGNFQTLFLQIFSFCIFPSLFKSIFSVV